MEHSETFAAVGIFVASMGEALKDKFHPKLPVSVMYMNGTEDPLVPYNGGAVTVNLFPRLNKMKGTSDAPRGRCIPTDDAVKLWVKRNKLNDAPIVHRLKDTDPADGSQVEMSLWKGGEQGTAVALYKVIGGGHTMPGGMQYLPERIIGRTNRDIEGFEVMWQFFSEHARKGSD